MYAYPLISGKVNHMAIIKMNFPSDILNLKTNITVILPSFFARMGEPGNYKDFYISGMKFQTLWLLHGGSGDDSDWLNFTSVARYADDNKVAVVMAPAFNSWYVDMAHGPRFFTFFTEELPQVCRVYFPLSDRREDNFVAGLSMGGNGAMRLALKRPDLYNTALCMSGVSPEPKEFLDPDSIFNQRVVDGKNPLEDVFGDLTKLEGSEEDMNFVAKRNVEQKKTLPKFLFGCGGDDFGLSGMKRTYDFLKGLGYDIQFEEIPGYEHEFDFWDLYIRKGLYELLDLKRSPILPE
jgi:putative tributyrin esterase